MINTTWSKLYVPEAIAAELMAISESICTEAKVVGCCLPGEKKKLTIVSPAGTFDYR